MCVCVFAKLGEVFDIREYDKARIEDKSPNSHTQ